jgi:hypothetical protein
MLINVREYSVLEAPINQSFDGCKENSKATLYVMQRDTGFMFIPVKKKYAEVWLLNT